jgi:hypothetical protein
MTKEPEKTDRKEPDGLIVVECFASPQAGKLGVFRVGISATTKAYTHEFFRDEVRRLAELLSADVQLFMECPLGNDWLKNGSH